MKHAFVVSCNFKYLPSLAATLNSVKLYGTCAEFIIAHDDTITKDLRDAFINSFSFKITWVDMSTLLSQVTIRSVIQPNPFWLAPWILGAQIIDNYDSIAILQADEFLLNNVDIYFKIAALTDIVIATEYTCIYREFEELPFGTTRSITNRGEYALYDQLVFMNKTHKQILIDVYSAQCIDAWKQEAQDPMCALNQACATYLDKSKVLGLDSNTWCADRSEWDSCFVWDNTSYKLYNSNHVRINAVHCRPWQQEVLQASIDLAKKEGEYYREKYENGVHNFNLLKDLQLWFNSMTLVTSNLEYYKGKYE